MIPVAILAQTLLSMACESEAKARLLASREAGVLPDRAFYLKIRKDVSFCLNARTSRAVQLWDSLGEHQLWYFEHAGDGYFRVRSGFHGGAACYLSLGNAGEVVVAENAALWAVELHGRWQFLALVEKETRMHLSVDPAAALARGMEVGLRKRTANTDYETRHWRLVPAANSCHVDGSEPAERRPAPSWAKAVPGVHAHLSIMPRSHNQHDMSNPFNLPHVINVSQTLITAR